LTKDEKKAIETLKESKNFNPTLEEKASFIQRIKQMFE
jgi:hypothetical protein